jgi:catechol 2,3-dioxygenase-like lactoylglutathione lyase family enzyme
LPVITSVNHVGLTVSNLDRAVAFYRDVLGLKVVMQQEKQGGYLEAITGYPGAHVRMAHLTAPGGGRLELFQYLEPRGSGRPADPRSIGITHACLVVDDVHEAHRRLVEAGAEPFSEPVEIDTGANAGAYGVYVRDPDGIVLELFQPKPS